MCGGRVVGTTVETESAELWKPPPCPLLPEVRTMTGWLATIRHDAERGTGATAEDTLMLVATVESLQRDINRLVWLVADMRDGGITEPEDLMVVLRASLARRAARGRVTPH